VSEEFLEHCADGALSVEVWGNRSCGFTALTGRQMDQMRTKSCSIADRSSHFLLMSTVCSSLATMLDRTKGHYGQNLKS